MPCSLETPKKARFPSTKRPPSIFMPPRFRKMPLQSKPPAPLATLSIKPVPGFVPSPTALLCPDHGVLSLDRGASDEATGIPKETPNHTPNPQLPTLPKRGRPKAEAQNSGEGPPGTMWLYTLGERPKYAGELDFHIMESYAASNPAARVSSATLATIHQEFAATDRFRSRLRRRRMERRKKGLQGVCEWRPELLYKTFVDCKPDFFEGSEYSDYVPLALCFGMINLRLPNAWRRRSDGVSKASRTRPGRTRGRKWARFNSPSTFVSSTFAQSAPTFAQPAPTFSELQITNSPLVSALARKRALDCSPERQRKRVAFAMDASDLATPRTPGLPQFVAQAAFEAAQAMARARQQGHIQW